MTPALTLSDDGITIRTADASVHVMGPVDVTDVRSTRIASQDSLDAATRLRELLGASATHNLDDDDLRALSLAVNCLEGTYDISREAS